MVDITTRLWRWAAIDDFAAMQEPELRELYAARAAMLTLLARTMEETGLTWRGAATVLRDSREFMMSPSTPRPSLPAVSVPELVPTMKPPQRKPQPTAFTGRSSGRQGMREPTKLGIPTRPPPKKEE